MSWLDSHADGVLAQWRANDLERRPATFDSAQGPVARIDGDELVLFSSSNYLGLGQHPRVVAAARAALETYGVGSGGSRLTTGTSRPHLEAERAVASFTGYDDAVLFSSGFHANTAILQALAGPDLVIVSDERNHASIIDGCRLAKASGATVRVSRHRDIEHVDALLGEHTGARCLVVTDGLFSMDGTLADLPGLAEVCVRHGAGLMVDDAHGIGTVGESGRGIVEHFAGRHRPDLLVVTASKALGCEGGFVACSAQTGAMLRQKARPFVYSTSLSPSVCAGIVAAVGVLESAESPVGRLHGNVDRLARHLGMAPWSSPIIPVRVGPEAEAVEVSQELRQRGLFVPAIRWPTVPRGEAILRVTVMATHTDEQIDELARVLREAGLPRR